MREPGRRARISSTIMAATRIVNPAIVTARVGIGGIRYRLTRAQPASIHTRMAALLIRCGPIRGSIRLVKEGCQGQELSRQADASHSKNAARTIIQYDIPVMLSS